MTGFVEGAYIDDERVIHNADGSLDESGRWVDDQGWVHQSTGELDGNWFIDAQGQPHDGQGMPIGQPIGIPQGWSVFYEPAADGVAWQGTYTEPGNDEAMAAAVMERQIAERDTGLSTTAPKTANPDALEAFSARLERPDDAPYAAGYTTGAAERLPQYKDENTKAGWHSPKNPEGDHLLTQYEGRDTLAERASGADRQGRVVDANGIPVADGEWGWVIDDETGYLMLFDPVAVVVVNAQGVERPKRSDEPIKALLAAGYKIRTTHHTSPVHGMPVTGAGVMRITNGFIAEITDESGHYRPEAPQQYAALQALMDEGYSLEDARVRLTGRDMGHGRPTDKAGWIDEARQANPNFPTGDVTLRPDQFMQTEGDEYQIRMKQGLNTEIRARGETPPTTEGEGRASPSFESMYMTDLAEAGSEQDSLRDSAGSIEARYESDSEQDSLRDSAGPIQARYESDSEQDRNTEDEADDSAEDPEATFVEQARSYLGSAGRSAFAEWFRTLTREQQDLLLADPDIGSAWRTENAPPAPAWQPAEGDQAAAATANAAFVDDLEDRQSAVFELGEFSLLIGDQHDAAHLAFVQGATDHVTGRVTVRKAGLGRGAGSLTFTGVPPAKRGVVQQAVARFSRKTVNFS